MPLPECVYPPCFGSVSLHLHISRSLAPSAPLSSLAGLARARPLPRPLPLSVLSGALPPPPSQFPSRHLSLQPLKLGRYPHPTHPLPGRGNQWAQLWRIPAAGREEEDGTQAWRIALRERVREAPLLAPPTRARPPWSRPHWSIKSPAPPARRSECSASPLLLWFSSSRPSAPPWISPPSTSLLSLSPDLPSDHGDIESSPGWASSRLWSFSSSDSSPAGVAARLPGRSTSLVEGRSCGWVPPPPGFAPLAPRPGTELSPSPTATPTTSSRYKTELCRTFSESGRCRYGAKCQFAHGPGELRQASRHPKYKTELCHKFYLQGRCPYGSRCHFIHNPSEDLAAPGHPHVLRQSISFSGLPSGRRSSPPPAGLAGPSLSSCSFSPSSSPPPPPPPGDLPLSPSAFSAAPGTPVARRDPTPACCPSCRRATPSSVWGPVGGLARSPSAHSLGSDPDEYASSGSSLGGSDSPVFEAGVFGPPQPPTAPRRLPIFNRISVSE